MKIKFGPDPSSNKNKRQFFFIKHYKLITYSNWMCELYCLFFFKLFYFCL